MYLLEGLEFFEKVLSSLVSVYQVGLKVHRVNLKDLDSDSTITPWPRIASEMQLAYGVLDTLLEDPKSVRSIPGAAKAIGPTMLLERLTLHILSRNFLFQYNFGVRTEGFRGCFPGVDCK